MNIKISFKYEIIIYEIDIILSDNGWRHMCLSQNPLNKDEILLACGEGGYENVENFGISTISKENIELGKKLAGPMIKMSRIMINNKYLNQYLYWYLLQETNYYQLVQIVLVVIGA